MSGKDDASTREDELIRGLRELPLHAPSPRSHEQVAASARAAFVRAFDDSPWYVKAFASAAHATVPVVLASVVGLYLFWAFAAAIALNQ